MAQRKSRRKLRFGLGRSFRRRDYKADHVLHEYEEHLVVKVMIERGYRASASEWCRMEPERWTSPAMLRAVFERLHKRKLLHPWGITRDNFKIVVKSCALSDDLIALVESGGDVDAYLRGNAKMAWENRISRWPTLGGWVK